MGGSTTAAGNSGFLRAVFLVIFWGLFVQPFCFQAFLRAEQVAIDSDGYAVINGKKRLVIGMYELPKDDEKLQELARSGFNLVRTPAKESALSRVQAFGLYAWIPLGNRLALKPGDVEGRRKLAAVIEAFRDHPALLAWEAPDEALWNVWYRRVPWALGGRSRALRKELEKQRNSLAAGLIRELDQKIEKADDLNERGLWAEAEALYDAVWKALGKKDPKPEARLSEAKSAAALLAERLERGWKLVHRLDPKHIRWQNHAPRNSISALRLFNRAVDAAGCDIYPVPHNATVRHSDLVDGNLTCVGSYTDRMRAAAPGKAVWMVLQGFGWRDLREKPPADPNFGRRPYFRETRFMAYEALLHRAGGILYWGTYKIEKDSRLWKDIMAVAREVRRLEPALVAPDYKPAPLCRVEETYGSVDGGGVRLFLRRVKSDWLLFALNESVYPLAFRVAGLPADLEGKTFYALYDKDAKQVEKGGFRDGIRALDVRVYATSRRFEDPERRKR